MATPGILLLSLFPILFGVVLAALSVRAIYTTVTRPRGGVEHPSCEKCRYPVSGLNTLGCPECGTDLRLTGIITRAMEARRRGGLGGAILGWSFLTLCMFGLITSGAMTFRSMAVAQPTFQALPTLYRTELKPASGAYQAAVIEQPSGWIISPATGEMYAAAVEVTLIDGSRHRLEVSPTRECTIPGASSSADRPGDQFSQETIATWYRTLGLDADDPSLAGEAGELAQSVESMLTLNSPNLISHSLSRFEVGAVTSTNSGLASPPGTSADRSWILVVAILTTAALVWTIGVVGIVLRRRALLREADSLAV